MTKLKLYSINFRLFVFEARRVTIMGGLITAVKIKLFFCKFMYKIGKYNQKFGIERLLLNTQ